MAGVGPAMGPFLAVTSTTSDPAGLRADDIAVHRRDPMLHAVVVSHDAGAKTLCPRPRVLDPDGLADHIDRLYRAAWALCGSRQDAEDLVQETFATVLKRPACYAMATSLATFCERSRTPMSAISAAPRADHRLGS